MIRNFPGRQLTRFVKLTSDCLVRGEFVKAGEIVELPSEEASQITGANRGRYTEAPKPKKSEKTDEK